MIVYSIKSFIRQGIALGVTGFALTAALIAQAATTPAAVAPAPAVAAMPNTAPGTAPIPPVLAAKAWLLIDMTSNQKLAGENDTTRVDPASLTKLMVDYLTLQAIHDKKLTLAQAIPVPADLYKRVDRRTESVMFIPPGKTATVDDLLHGLIIQSGNDAAVVLAEAVGGSEASFVELMNREAKRLGMNSTSFRNPSGMSDPQHYTTAADLAILVSHLITEFPEFYPLYSQKEFTYNGIKQGNRNLLLWKDNTVDGVKTGHTDAAGYCLIASAKRPQPTGAGGGDRRLLSVVMGANSADARAQESLKLLNWGFQNFDAVRLYDANQSIATPRLWKGTEKEIRLGFQHPVFMTLPKGQAGNIKSTLDRKDPLVAPINAGDRVGTLKLTLDGKPIADLPVVSLDTVPQAGFFGRAWDAVRLMVK
jgi:D-alanyl-D-alanine carboxypeptidase (penicillin-binding protein 5/6)